MKLKSIPGGGIGNFLAGVAVASVAGGGALATTSSNFTYTATQTAYLTIGPMSMTPGDSFSANEYTFSPTGINTTSTGGACFVAGVNLPQGAVLRNLTVFFNSDNKGDLQVNFFRRRLSDFSFNALISKQPVENSGAYTVIFMPISPQFAARLTAATLACYPCMALRNATRGHGAGRCAKF